MKKQKLGVCYVLAAGILWGVIGIFIRIFAQNNLASLQVTFIRVIFSAVFLISGTLLYDRSLLKIRLRDCWCFIGAGILGFTFFNYCYFTTMQYTSLSVAAVLLYTAPVIVMILSVFLFHERLNLRKIGAFALAFGGCVCTVGLFGGELALSAKGILLGFGSGLGYGLVTIFNRYALQKGYHPLTIVIYTFVFAVIGIAWMIDITPVVQTVFQVKGLFFISCLFAVVSTILPNLAYTLGMKYMENGKAAIIASVEPIAATVTGVIVFHEKLDLYGIVGILLMIAALVILNGKSEPQLNNK